MKSENIVPAWRFRKALEIARRTIKEWDRRLPSESVKMAEALLAIDAAVRRVIRDNLHLADGENSTLGDLVKLIPDRLE